MIEQDTPIGTRVRRIFDGKVGTVVVKPVETYNDRPIFGVRFDDQPDGDAHWWGNDGAWELVVNPERTSGAELARLMLEALRASDEASYQRGLYVGGKRETYPDEQIKTANEAAVKMWTAFYERESR